MSERRREGCDNGVVNLEDLKSRESTRISTAEDVKALLEAEFRGIAEIQNSQKLSEDEFKQIESLYWHKMGQSADGRTLYAGGRSTLNGGGEYGADHLQTMTMPLQQYTTSTLPETRLINYDYPKETNSLRHETKMKRHVLEEVVLEDSDKFYEKTLPRKTKNIYIGNKKSVSSGELRNPYQNDETLQRNRNLDHVVMRDQYMVPNAKPRHMKKHQSEIIVGDTLNDEVTTNRSYLVNKENFSTFPKEYHMYANNQERQNEIRVEGIQTFKDKNSANTPLKLRHNFENEIQQMILEKEKQRKSRLEGTECKIRHNPKINQNEIVLDDKLLIEETQHFAAKKSPKKPAYTARISAPKFKNRFRRSKKSHKKKDKVDYSPDVHNVPILLSSRKNQEEVVLENLNTFSETSFSKKKKFETSGSLEKSQNRLREVEQDLYEQSTSRFQPIEHKGPQKEIYLSGQEFVSETTLTRPKKKRFKKSPKFNAEVTNLSTQILESQKKQTSEDDSVILTKVIQKEPQYSYEDSNKEVAVTQQGIDENGLYVEENRKKLGAKGKAPKSVAGKQKSKRSLFKRKKVVSEIVIEDSEIYEDHNKPKKIHFAHGGVMHLAEVDDMDLTEYVDEEKEKEAVKNKKNNKQKNNKKPKKTKKQGETIVDKSFVYEDASTIGIAGKSGADAETKSKQEITVDSGLKENTKVESESEALKGESKVKPNINILNIQDETILNGNYFVSDDTKFKLTSNTTEDKMDENKKDEKDEKIPKFKFKLPDYLKKKSKSSEQKEEKSVSKTEDHKGKIKPENEPTVIVETTPKNIDVETTQKESVEIKKDEGNNKFKFHMPDIHISKPSFSSKTVGEKIEIGKSEKVESEPSEKIKSRPSEKIVLETKATNGKKTLQDDFPEFKFTTENRETTVEEKDYVVKEIDNSQKDVNIVQQVNLPNIRVKSNSEKSTEIIKKEESKSTKEVTNLVTKPKCGVEEIKKIESKSEIKEVGKPKDEVIEITPHEEIDNDKTIILEKTIEEKKSEKKSKITFPKFNISKPSFGRKYKEKQTEVITADKKVELIEEIKTAEPSQNTLPKVDLSINKHALEITKKEENKIVNEATEDSDKKEENSFTAVLPVVNISKPQLPQVPPPPIFKKYEKISQAQTNIVDEETKESSPEQKTKEINVIKTHEETFDVLLPKIPKPKLNLKLKTDKKSITNLPSTKVEVIEKKDKVPEKEAVITLNAADSQPAENIEQMVVVDAPKETFIKDEKVPDKKFKIHLPHFNISKPSFTLKKNKEHKNKDEKAFDEIVTSVGSQKEVKMSEEEKNKDITDKIVDDTSNKESKINDFRMILPDVNVTKPSLPHEPFLSTSLQKTEILKLDDDVFVEDKSLLQKEIVEVTVPERINSPEVNILKPDLNLKYVKPNIEVKENVEAQKREVKTTDPIKTRAIDLNLPEVTSKTETKNILDEELPKEDTIKKYIKEDKVDEKVKVPNKKYKFNFPTFGRKNKEKQTDIKEVEEIVNIDKNKTQESSNATVPKLDINVCESNVEETKIENIKIEEPKVEEDKKEQDNIFTVTLPDTKITKPKRPVIPPSNVSFKEFEDTKIPQSHIIAEETKITLPEEKTIEKTMKSQEEKVFDVVLPAANIIQKDLNLNITHNDHNEDTNITKELEKIKETPTENLENRIDKTDIKKANSKVESMLVDPVKDDVDENKKKKQKSGFSNFSMPKPNFNFGFKSKKDKNVEQPKPQKSVETLVKTDTVLDKKDKERERNIVKETITHVKDFVEEKTESLSKPIEISQPTVKTTLNAETFLVEKPKENVQIESKIVTQCPQVAIETTEKSQENKTFDVVLPEVNIPKPVLNLRLNQNQNDIKEHVPEETENLKKERTEKVANLVNTDISSDIQKPDSKIESIQKEPAKDDVDENKKKKQKSGFSNFSMPKPNFNFGFKSKKDTNVEQPSVTQEETKKTPSKQAMDWTCGQKEITVKGDAIVEDSTKLALRPQKSVEAKEKTVSKTEDKEVEKNIIEQTVTHVITSLEEKADALSKPIELSQPILETTPDEQKIVVVKPKEDSKIESKIITDSNESAYINVAETKTKLNTNTVLEKIPISNPIIDLKNEKDINIETTESENKPKEDSSSNTFKKSDHETAKVELTPETAETDKVETLKSEKNKPTFMGKLKSNLPQICIQKSVSIDDGSSCLGKKNQEKVEVTSKTIVAENIAEKQKHETAIETVPSTENKIEKKKKINILEKLHLKKPQKEVVINDTHLYTDSSTLAKKKKDKIYILENDISEESPKKKCSWSKGKKQKAMDEAQKKEKQGEVVVVGDTLVTESMKLSTDNEIQETQHEQEGRLSAFLDEASKEVTADPASCKQDVEVSKNNIVLDANNKPIFNQKNVLEKEKSVENVQIEATTDREKSRLLIDEAGNEIPVNETLQESIQTSTPIKPTNAIDEQNKEQTQTDSKNLKWNQSPNKKSAFFSTVPAAVSCHDDRKPLQFVVVAIDFGTTFSGYAFSFNRDIDSIHVMRKWEGGDPGVTNQKTPTTLLLNPEGQFHSFGFTARDFYHDLSPKEALKWMYFEKFKMALHYNADLSSETEIRAANGNNFKALDVFSHALKFFRNHAIQEIGEQSNTPIYEEDIKWVITVPAIWKSPAKQFMREAAYKAGIASADKSERLLIALEPEAASVFVRKQRLKQLIPESADDLKDTRSVGRSCQELTPPEHVDNITYPTSTNYDDASSHDQSLSSGVLNQSFNRCPSPTSFPVSVGQDVDITDNRFMVADCGGGTADITVYEMLSATGGKLKELYKATGGPYGSIGVDLEFENLLVSIFGADYVEAFKMKRPAGWVDLMMAFESRKRAANPFKCKPLNVPLPFSFIDYHKKFKNSSVETVIKKYNSKNVLWSSQGMLRLLPEAMDQLFQPTLDAIVKAIREVISQPDVAGVSNVFMVGGFSESPMLQQEIRKNFANQSRILIPNDVSLTILKGAVLFGIDPSVVVIRKSRLTYGLGVLNRFLEGKHPEAKKAMKDGEAWCVDVFDPLVVADQSVALGTSVIRSYTPAASNQKFSLFHIYCSEDKNVDFVTEGGVAKCGTLRLDLDDHQWELESTPSRPVSQHISSQEAVEESGVRREIQARLTFGDTEIKLVALDVVTGNYVRATLDFLNK